MKWEKLPNGKWKPIKEFRKSADGKYDPVDPVYKAKVKRRLNTIKKICDICGEYTLLNPCIHHLADGYKNDKRRDHYKKAMKDSQKISFNKDEKLN